MSKYLEQHQVFPVALGNEEESGVLVNVAGYLEEPCDLVENFSYYVPEEYVVLAQRYRVHLKNGGRVYPGYVAEDLITNLERTTGECATPREVLIQDKGNQLVLEGTIKNYLQAVAWPESETSARVQRRVVDSIGNRKASHDNYGIADDTPLKPTGSSAKTPRSIVEHLATRSFITGAGLVEPDGFSYAQKIGGLAGVTGYGYKGLLYRRTDDEGTHRFEVRCSDINISDWAVLARVGGTALVLALNQTPLGKELDQKASVTLTSILDKAKELNIMHLTPEGTLQLTPEQYAAVDFQQTIAEMAMAKLPLYIDELPPEYFEIAHEIYQYCEDYRKVASGEAGIELLADRADWAAKLTLILRGVEKDRSFGINRELNDITSRAKDLRYDFIGFSAVSGEVAKPEYGTGYRLRAKGQFRKTVAGSAIQKGLLTPSPFTRATARTQLLSDYNCSYADWQKVSVMTTEYDQEDIILRDVDNPTLDPAIVALLDKIGMRNQQL